MLDLFALLQVLLVLKTKLVNNSMFIVQQVTTIFGFFYYYLENFHDCRKYNFIQSPILQ